MARDRPDVLILDLGLPDMDGTEVISGVRGWTSIPIIVLSVGARRARRSRRWISGADDYVTKPFGMDELLARLRDACAAPPRPRRAARDHRHFTVDLAAKRVVRAAGGDIRLTPTRVAATGDPGAQPRALVTQRQLLQEVWGPSYETESNYLRVYLAQLRRKLEPEPSRPRYCSPSREWVTASRTDRAGPPGRQPPPLCPFGMAECRVEPFTRHSDSRIARRAITG